MDLKAIQEALKEAGLDGWLFYDFHNRDMIAARILNMDTKRFASRRWFYYIPAEGEPQKLVHRIEPWRCDHLPGEKHVYLPWQEQHRLLRDILKWAKKIAMQYSPMNAIPYVSIVDAGTYQLIKSFGVEIVSSADLVSKFESHLSMEDWQSHVEAGKILQMVKDEAFKEICKRIKSGQNPTEYEIYEFMVNLMKSNGLTFNDGPIVAVNEHAADPHFEPTPANTFKMKEGDLVLIDLWAKLDKPRSIYYDITWMGFIGETVPEKIENIFQIARNARDTALNLVKRRFSRGEPLYGWEVDDACRNVIREAGLAEYFTHRTGHNIGEEVHGNGVNIDNLETKDERLIIPGTCFSVEPGIYMEHEKIGFRTEIDVFVTDEGKVEVSGAIQEKVIPILTLV
ncbi:MAG: aminopeptidase P family protein [Candidatus Kapabacteria bacterium]|nr:aminopeptidase P family protein [Candidatus Kapabacteria bacterium]